MDKFTTFNIEGTTRSVTFVESQEVKEGVNCDVYSIVGDKSFDLAVVKVQKGFKTPLQRVLKGDTTTEGHIGGSGILTVVDGDNLSHVYKFPNQDGSNEVIVHVGQLMQWFANGDDDLMFYEICHPPYQDGRFQNLPETE